MRRSNTPAVLALTLLTAGCNLTSGRGPSAMAPVAQAPIVEPVRAAAPTESEINDAHRAAIQVLLDNMERGIRAAATLKGPDPRKALTLDSSDAETAFANGVGCVRDGEAKFRRTRDEHDDDPVGDCLSRVRQQRQKFNLLPS